MQVPRYIITLHELLAHTPHNHVERRSLENAKSKLEELSRVRRACSRRTPAALQVQSTPRHTLWPEPLTIRRHSQVCETLGLRARNHRPELESGLLKHTLAFGIGLHDASVAWLLHPCCSRLANTARVESASTHPLTPLAQKVALL